MKENIFKIIGKENPMLGKIDDWICQTAEKAASEGDGKRWTKKSRTAICRWVLRSLVYGELKSRVLDVIQRN